MTRADQQRLRIALALLDWATPAGDPAAWAAVVGHSRRVARLAEAVAVHLGLDRAATLEVGLAALLHDVGKARVPVEVLTRTGALSPEDWRLVRAHSEHGEQAVGAVPDVAEVAGVVRHVHERWDGRGYPDGLAGQAIPEAARIIAACDAYIAMTERRPYGPVLRPRVALRELEASAGTQFDPRLPAAVGAATGLAAGAGSATGHRVGAPAADHGAAATLPGHAVPAR